MAEGCVLALGFIFQYQSAVVHLVARRQTPDELELLQAMKREREEPFYLSDLTWRMRRWLMQSSFVSPPEAASLKSI
jgi:hypothetical protein